MRLNVFQVNRRNKLRLCSLSITLILMGELLMGAEEKIKLEDIRSGESVKDLCDIFLSDVTERTENAKTFIREDDVMAVLISRRIADDCMSSISRELFYRKKVFMTMIGEIPYTTSEQLKEVEDKIDSHIKAVLASLSSEVAAVQEQYS